MNRLFCFILILVISFSNCIAFSQNTVIDAVDNQCRYDKISSYAPGFEPALKIIFQMPEVRTLFNRLDRPISIVWTEQNQNGFRAYWNYPSRTIMVDPKAGSHFPTLIWLILFELHNSLTTNEMLSLNQKARLGRIVKDDYVRSFEKLEWENVLATQRIIERGVEREVFPKSTQSNFLINFESHYKLQQLTGHAQFHAHNFDQLTRGAIKPYRGTITDLTRMTQSQKNTMIQSLRNQNRL